MLLPAVIETGGVVEDPCLAPEAPTTSMENWRSFDSAGECHTWRNWRAVLFEAETVKTWCL